MSFTTFKTVAFPVSEIGQTVTYALYNAAGTQVTSGVSGAVAEIGGGIYGASITVPDGANYAIIWTETTGLLLTAADAINPTGTSAPAGNTAFHTASFGATETGQTVTYTIYDQTGTMVTSGVSGTVVELGGGSYGANITVPAAANYAIIWTETTGLLRTAVGSIRLASAAGTSTAAVPPPQTRAQAAAQIARGIDIVWKGLIYGDASALPPEYV